MKRKLSVILAAAMLASSFGMSAMAEESVQARFTDYDQVNQAITVIAGTDTQKELGYLDGVTTILEVDGLKFKDLNGNGQVDVYEDWQQDVDVRVTLFQRSPVCSSHNDPFNFKRSAFLPLRPDRFPECRPRSRPFPGTGAFCNSCRCAVRAAGA